MQYFETLRQPVSMKIETMRHDDGDNTDNISRNYAMLYG